MSSVFSTPPRAFSKKIDPADKGKFLHYHVFLKTAANVQYEVVIDVNDVSPTKPLIYRIASLNSQTSAELAANFGPVLGATSDFHIISNTESSFGPILNLTDDPKKAAGALDFLRHPGLLEAERNLPWQNMLAVTTADPLQWALPILDAIFKDPPRPPTHIPSSTCSMGHSLRAAQACMSCIKIRAIAGPHFPKPTPPGRTAESSSKITMSARRQAAGRLARFLALRAEC
jgi:hypothetical protein